jgi:hypothetical protein
MELHCKDPESVRKLSLRLFGKEAFEADFAAVIFNSVDWIDAVLGNSETQLSGNPRNDLVRQLNEVRQPKGSRQYRVRIGSLHSCN